FGSVIRNTGLRLKSGIGFSNIHFGPKGDIIIGINKRISKVIKIGIIEKNTRKSLSLEEESALLKDLNKEGCASCPGFIESGFLSTQDLLSTITPPIPEQLFNLPDQLPYMVIEYIESDSRMRLADLVLALLEQKNLGYYHGDLKPANIRFNKRNGVCVMIDYDQTINLSDEVIKLNAMEFLEWCDKFEQQKYKMPTWRRHFKSLTKEHFAQILQDNALDLSQTSLFAQQITTNSPGGIYQSIRHADIVVNGSRDLSDRIDILESIDFKQKEKVLDIGCNAGLLCHYLHDRGCKVIGAELDSYMVTAAGIISRITHRNIEFICFDLDKNDIPGHFDTIMLFSVLHHSFDLSGNARKVAAACNRIIIECRAVESGKKPEGQYWQETTKWDYGDVNGLIEGLENLFLGFILKNNHGIGGKNRYILEFAKKVME
ncbi:MAG: methyltransferase domain-containing protein, partial [Anaerolineaceae bacterium]|nr:methyltransferase domain-containing protein [Anaerolineaceae bacterium]